MHIGNCFIITIQEVAQYLRYIDTLFPIQPPHDAEINGYQISIFIKE